MATVQATNTLTGLPSGNLTLTVVLPGAPPSPPTPVDAPLTLSNDGGSTLVATLRAFVDAAGSTALSYHYRVGLAGADDDATVPEACVDAAAGAAPGAALTLRIPVPGGLTPRTPHHVTVRVVDAYGRQRAVTAAVTPLLAPPAPLPTAVPLPCRVALGGPGSCRPALAAWTPWGGPEVVAVQLPGAAPGGEWVIVTGCWNRTVAGAASDGGDAATRRRRRLAAEAEATAAAGAGGAAFGMRDDVAPGGVVYHLQLQQQSSGGWAPLSPWLPVGAPGGSSGPSAASAEVPLLAAAGTYRVVARGTNAAGLSSEVACPQQLVVGACCLRRGLVQPAFLSCFVWAPVPLRTCKANALRVSSHPTSHSPPRKCPCAYPMPPPRTRTPRCV